MTFLKSRQTSTYAPRCWARYAALSWLGTAVAAFGIEAVYDFGNPSQNEQYMIEMLNRSRANPSAEATRILNLVNPAVTSGTAMDYDIKDAFDDSATGFLVNRPVFAAQMALLPATQPLAPSAKLMTMARSHTTWMFNHVVQQHAELATETDVQSIIRRIQAVSYPYGYGTGENIYSYAHSMEFAHVGFEVDWADEVNGMFSYPGHRFNNHSAESPQNATTHDKNKEVGIGLAFGLKSNAYDEVGPVVGTMDFSNAYNNNTPFVTGVVYYDLNGNGFFDPGEGVKGIQVNASGAGFFTTTADGGGYAIPLPIAAASRTLTFQGLNLSATRSIAIASTFKNVKSDVALTYTPPAISGPATIYNNAPASTYGIAMVPGAQSYEWIKASKSAAVGENADSSANVTASITGGYAVVQSSFRASGTGAFHLAHVNSSTVEDQFLTLNPTFLATSTSTLNFQSRLTAANVREVARVQISLDDGGTWKDIWAQSGAGNLVGESSFVSRSVSLAPYAGRLFRLRLAYTQTGSYWTYSSTAGAGWFIDTLTLPNTSQLGGIVRTPQSGTGFSYAATQTDSAVFAGRPIVSGIGFPYGPALEVTSQPVAFTTWAADVEAAAGMPAGSLASQPTADWDADGIPNLLEYGSGTNPASPNPSSAPQFSPSRTDLSLTFVRDTWKPDVSVGVQASPDMIHWFDPGQPGAPAGFTCTVEGSTNGNSGQERCRGNVPIVNGQRVYLRIRASRL